MVMNPQVSRQQGTSLLGVLERHGVGPFLAEGLSEPLGLAVGTWHVEQGADVRKDAAGFGKGLGDVGRSVVAHHLTTVDAISVEPGQCPTQEADRSNNQLFGKRLDVGEPCGLVDGHVDPVVSNASKSALLPVACDAVTDLAEAGPATCKHSEEKSLLPRPILLGGDSRTGT